MFSQIGPLEIAIVLLIVLIVFGPKRLPGLGRSLGSGMREFKDAITGNKSDEDDEDAFGERPRRAQEALPGATSRPADEQEHARESVGPGA
jgi:sec-independent protein translocase protein TatA